MAGAVESYRLAIASLGVPQPLRLALEELHSNAVSEADLCLAGIPDSLDRVRVAVAQSQDSIVGSLLDVQPLRLTGDLPVLATSNRLMTTKMKSGTSEPAGPCWLSPQMRSGLVERMAQGDVVVVAGPLTAKQLADATRVLLRHSKHHVQSHTFVRPSSR